MHTQIYDINRRNVPGKTSVERKEKRNNKKKTSAELRRAHSTSPDVHARRAQHHPLANAPAEMTDGQITELHKHIFFFFRTRFFFSSFEVFFELRVPGGGGGAVKN